jgi:inner membrane protein
MTWWVWLMLALGLALAELLTPGGFYLLFFGCGAAVVGLLSLAGIGLPLWIEGLLFTGLSVVALLLFRRPLLEKMGKASPVRAVDSLVGETAIALELIAVGGVGKAELRGTGWNALNTGSKDIEPRQRCKVERIDGLTLSIRPE